MDGWASGWVGGRTEDVHEDRDKQTERYRQNNLNFYLKYISEGRLLNKTQGEIIYESVKRT